MKAKEPKKPTRSKRRRPAAAALAGVLATVPAGASPAATQVSDETIAKMSAGALRRLLLNLRAEDEQAAKNARMAQSRDHDSHVMHGSHSSFGSHGQHTSFTNSTR